MVLRFYSQVLEDGVGPETLHMILPSVSQSSPMMHPSCQLLPSSLFVHGEWGSVDRILPRSERFQTSTISRKVLTRSTRCCYCLVADKEVQILCATFRVEVAGRTSSAGQEGGFVADSRTARA